MDQAALSSGTLDRQTLEAAAVGTVCCEAPQALCGAFTTGHIPRQSFERVLENTLVDSEVGAGPSPDHFTETERLGRLVPDQHPDEHATCYIVRGRGLVVISSCGHVGLINTIKAAMAVPRGRQIARGARRVSSRPGAAGLCRSHGSRARSAIARRGYPDALQRRQVPCGDASADARPPGHRQYRQPLYVRRLSATRRAIYRPDP